MRWTVHLDGGPVRVNHAAVSIGSRILSFGGYCTGDDYEKIRPMDIYVLNTVNLRWTLLPLQTDDTEFEQIPYLRYGHTAVEYDHSAYIWGGRNDSEGPCNVLFQFNGVSLKWSKPTVTGCKPEARDGHTACMIKSCMYIFGGYEELSNRFSNDMRYIDLETLTWFSVITSGLPARWRDFHTATAVNDVMYIFGGRSDEGGNQFTNHEVYCNKLVAFDTRSRTWFEPGVSQRGVPSGRRSHSAFVYNGNIYVFGGYNGLRWAHYNDLHMLDLALMQWKELRVPGNSPLPCRRQCCCVIDSKAYFFGGTSPANANPYSVTIRSDPDFEMLGESHLIDQSDLHILDLAPSLKTLASMVVLQHGLDCRFLPADIRWDLKVMTTNNTISPSKLSCTHMSLCDTIYK